MNSIKKQGFTLIELLVAVFIFAILFLIIMAFVSLAAGQPKSAHTKALTTSLRHTIDTINQKMNTANARYVTTSSGGNINIFGFNINNGVLGIINLTGTTASPSTQCTFFGEKQDTDAQGTYWRLFMSTDNHCNNIPNSPNWPDASQLQQAITDNTISLDPPPNGLIFSGNFMASKNDSPPYLIMTINARDRDPKYADNNAIKFQTSYTLPYQTIIEFRNKY